MISWAYINNEFIKEEQAVLHVRDLSILRGYAIFDFFRFSSFRPVFIDQHLARLQSSAGGLGLSIEKDNQELKAITKELIERNKASNGGIRITVTGGISENGYNPSRSCLVITQHNFDELTPEQFEKGIHLLSFEHQRQLPHIKTSDYIMGISLQPWIREQKADDVLFMKNRIITECPRANIFTVNPAGQLCTPAAGILQGVTRKMVMQLAAAHYEVIEKDISLEDIYLAQEVFITSTTKTLLPVRMVDHHSIGKGNSPVGTHILQLYNAVSSVASI
jgi:branched-chain amino acid aminotransferase